MADETIKYWTRLLGTSNGDFASSINTAADGSIYITGGTNGSLDGQNYSGELDAFISKYSSDGSKAWTRLLGSSTFDKVYSISTAADGSIYITGYTNGSLDGQTNSGVYDAFISKYSSDGTKGWTRLLGSSFFDSAHSVSTAADGSIYITGATLGSLDGQTNSGDWDIFISKYSSDGSKAWTRLLGTSTLDSADSISTAADGSIYITGTTRGSLDGQSYRGDRDAFISKYSSDGIKAWTRLLGTSSGDFATSIDTAADGSIYITGYTKGSLDGQTNSGSNDAFISKYSSNGIKAWTRLLGSTSWDEARSISTAADGSIYISGYTNGSFDGQTNSGGSDAFISKYSSDGTKAWTRFLGSSSYDSANSISTAVDGSFYITGETQGSFDGQTNSGGSDTFISKYRSNNDPTGTPTLSGTTKVGQVISIDKTAIQDADNFTGYTPTYNYSFEVSNDNGTTWTKLISTDATDNNTTYTLTAAEVGRSIRGVVSYLDGYGTNESVASLGSSVTSAAVVRGNSLYTIVDGPSWTQAEANSVKLGGHLVTINDVSENEFLANQGDLREKLDIEPWALNQIFGVTSTKASQSAWIGRERFNLGDWEWSSTDNSEYVSALLPSRYIPSFPIQSIILHQVEQFFIENKREDLQPVATQLIYFDPLNGSEKKGAWSEIFDVDSMYDLDKDGRYSALSDGFSHHDNSKQGIAETPFIRRGDSAYVIVQGPTWEEAEANAVKLGGHLVTINDSEEEQFLLNNTQGGWIGYTDKLIEGQWKWVDGTPKGYERWDQNNPSNNNGAEHYAYLDVGAYFGWGAGWNDVVTNSNMRGIAEIKLAPNNTSTGTPTLSGTTKVGQVITIDKTPIQDVDNFTGYTPSYNYSFEVSTDNGVTWTKLTSTDATDNNNTYTLTTAEIGKQVRGVVSYLDGYGTNEVVASDAPASITDPSPTYTLTPSSTSVNEGSSISYNLTTTNVSAGTSLYYQFSGTGITAADFSSATTIGTEVVGSNGQLTISRTLTVDKTTEGTENLILKIFTDSAATTPLATNTAVTVNDTSLIPSMPTQKVYTEKPEISYKPTGVAALPLLYTTSSNDANLSGLTLNVHYNSSFLTPTGSNNGVSGQVDAAITTTTILSDTSNSDGDPLTDKIVQLLWATFDNSFPNKTLPTAIATVSFDTSAIKKDPVTGHPLSTTVRYTAAEAAPNYDFLTGSTILKAQQFNLDVDGDGKVTALGDGLMVIRKLFGAAFSGDALTAKARSDSAIRSTSEIHDFIQQGIDSGMLDVDKDGKTTALGDGLMVIRRLFGAAFDGGALTSKAISSSSPYFGPPADFASVAFNIDALKPTFI
jgi:hypothetical protein